MATIKMAENLPCIVYYSGQERYSCVKKLSDVNIEKNLKAKEKREQIGGNNLQFGTNFSNTRDYKSCSSWYSSRSLLQAVISHFYNTIIKLYVYFY